MTPDSLSLENTLLLIAGVCAMSLIPLLALSCTSFLKLSVVLGVLRSAIGAQSIPSAGVVTVLSLALTAFIMEPIFRESAQETRAAIAQKDTNSSHGQKSVDWFLDVARASSVPLSQFLRIHCGIRERKFFISARHQQNANVTDPAASCQTSGVAVTACAFEGENLATLIPSFVISQLREAFTLGFMLYLPFLVIDLLVAHVLMALGMMMVSPATIALPLKLILFVLSDGWLLLMQSLVLGYR